MTKQTIVDKGQNVPVQDVLSSLPLLETMTSIPCHRHMRLHSFNLYHSSPSIFFFFWLEKDSIIDLPIGGVLLDFLAHISE